MAKKPQGDRETQTITSEEVGDVRTVLPEDMLELRAREGGPGAPFEKSAKTWACGYVEDPVDERDLNARALFGARRSIPDEAQGLEGCLSGVYNQGPAEGCVGQAIGGSIDARLRKMGRWDAPKASRRGIWTIARALARPSAQIPLVNEGSQPRLAMKGLRMFGVPSEDTVPTDLDKMNEELPWGAMKEASAFTLDAFWRIDALGKGGIEDMCQALGNGFPVVFGLSVDKAFNDHTGKKVLGAINQAETVGGHMMFTIGYRTEKGRRVFKCVNSWGVAWGDAGLFEADEEFFRFVKDRYVIQVG